MTDPLGDFVIDYLLSQTKETNYHDFKKTLSGKKDSNDFPKIIKDVYGFSNAGGGFLVLGVHQNDHCNEDIKGPFAKLGLPDDFEIEQASLQEKINSYLEVPLEIGFTEFTRTFYGKERNFALVYIPPSPKILVPPEDGTYKEGDKVKKAFVKGETYTRRGTQCVPARDYEIDRMKKRVKNENYRLSIISGEPDEVDEILHSNLFKVTSLPDTVYVGTALYSSFADGLNALKENHPGKYFFNLRYRPYEDKIVTFQNLYNPNNYHSELVVQDTIHKEPLDQWLDDEDKERIIISLLNKEVRAHGQKQGMRLDDKSGRLYYPASGEYRSELWSTRYKGIQAKQVAKLMWAEQLGHKVYAHAAVKPTITKLHGRFYLRLNLTMIITDDGRQVTKDSRSGTIITRSLLNNILFWISKLGDGKDLYVVKGFVISHKPVQTTINTGINWDIPTSDLKKFIEEFDAQANDDEEEEEELEEGDQYDGY
ncbi:MAG: ATP-binding protein [Nitrosopumilaceae archaeon]|nr:ATP-binding protein [Nitrosopumilaceae archaeon]